MLQRNLYSHVYLSCFSSHYISIVFGEKYKSTWSYHNNDDFIGIIKDTDPVTIDIEETKDKKYFFFFLFDLLEQKLNQGNLCRHRIFKCRISYTYVVSLVQYNYVDIRYYISNADNEYKWFVQRCSTRSVFIVCLNNY